MILYTFSHLPLQLILFIKRISFALNIALYPPDISPPSAFWELFYRFWEDGGETIGFSFAETLDFFYTFWILLIPPSTGLPITQGKKASCRNVGYSIRLLILLFLLCSFGFFINMSDAQRNCHSQQHRECHCTVYNYSYSIVAIGFGLRS